MEHHIDTIQKMIDSWVWHIEKGMLVGVYQKYVLFVYWKIVLSLICLCSWQICTQPRWPNICLHFLPPELLLLLTKPTVVGCRGISSVIDYVLLWTETLCDISGSHWANPCIPMRTAGPHSTCYLLFTPLISFGCEIQWIQRIRIGWVVWCLVAIAGATILPHPCEVTWHQWIKKCRNP